MTNPTPPTDPPAAPEIDPAHQAQFNAMFGAAMKSFIEENKPAPDKTPGRPGGVMDWLLGTGQGGK